MARHKRWYDPNVAASVHVIPQMDRDGPINPLRWKHPRVAPTLGECLIYPLNDGPGLGLLILLPPVLWILSLPIFDIIAVMHPLTKSDWAIGLLIVPILVPVLFSFSMTFGYALLFLGHMLVSSALGEIDHPRWPEWHPADIAEGLCRWFWAGLFGAFLGGIPVAFYWSHCGPVDWFDCIVFAELIMFGAGYALMALAASLLHENIIAANPITVISSIVRLRHELSGSLRDRERNTHIHRAGCLGPALQVAQYLAGGSGSLGFLGRCALFRHGHGTDDGFDVPCPRSGSWMVPAATAVGLISSSGPDLRQLLTKGS